MSRVSKVKKGRVIRATRWLERLGIDVRPRRRVRRPTEEEALRRILIDEKRVARAARQQAWVKEQRGKHSR